ncbi:ubiquitin fusion degradation protein UFD1-domain-containing protein [Lipomyces oligophaga]|uniref:ubiquitin fusion degradation protein UFD1-domain-containing protein n=1 Tax=Lipomyces oligophaga TaxID=45792 RepID=UPI0034CD74BF
MNKQDLSLSVPLQPRLLDSLAHSDRVLLPQPVLEQLISSSGNSPLPSPLTFKLTNSATGVSTHCGVREFSAPDGTIAVSKQLASLLGLPLKLLSSGPDQAPNQIPSIIVEFVDLPKGTFVKLRPLGTSYLAIEDNWRDLLESCLQANYTTLTQGQTFSVVQPGTQHELVLLVDQLQPAPAVCIIQTDLSVDIEAISEDQARKSVATRNAKLDQFSSPTSLSIDSPRSGLLSSGAGSSNPSVNSQQYFELKNWDKTLPLSFELEILDDENASDPEIDSRCADLFIMTDDKPTKDYYLWSTITEEKNSIQISSMNPELASAQVLYIAVEAFTTPLRFVLVASQLQSAAKTGSPNQVVSVTDSEQCLNCRQYFPLRTFQLHSAYCERNNILCPFPECGRVFRRQEGIPISHWHCQQCDFASDSVISKDKHLRFHHTDSSCVCGAEFQSGDGLSRHRATDCPQKLHLCRFCHLRLPQEGVPESQADILVGYSGHEAHCGTRTTDCSRCNGIVRLRDLDSHMKLHDMERVSVPQPLICTNPLCIRALETGQSLNPLGLCSSCFGPLYSPVHDPTGARLRSRIERRLHIQSSTGCRRGQCQNTDCATGRQNMNMLKYTPAESRAAIKRMLDSSTFQFCVDDSVTKRRQLVDWIVEDREYPRAWVCKAVMEAGISEDMENHSETAARSWLIDHGVRVDEVRA